MHDTILMPVNLGEPATWEAVLPSARALLSDGGTLHVITVVPDLDIGMLSGYFPPDYPSRALAEAGQRLDELVRSWADATGDAIEFRAHVLHGKIASQIIEAAQKVGAGAIVMASHKPAMVDHLIGANALRVVQRAPMSVMVVRP